MTSRGLCEPGAAPKAYPGEVKEQERGASGETESELGLTERVGREFVRLGLKHHAAHARRYYAAVRAGRAPGDGAWTHEMIVEWCRLLRLPPHETDYVVRPRMASCSACERSQSFTQTVFPGGSKHRCGACGEEWLELDSPAATR